MTSFRMIDGPEKGRLLDHVLRQLRHFVSNEQLSLRPMPIRLKTMA